MTPGAFVERLARVRLPNVFNPYSDKCPVSDSAESPGVRRMNLVLVLEAASEVRSILWLGRDLGYRGGRRTGLALTDERHLAELSQRWGGIPITKATRDLPVSERTAAVVWGVIARLSNAPLLWNVFPFHPHDAGHPLSNRPHTRKEFDASRALLEAFLAIANPVQCLAIGNDAYRCLSKIGVNCSQVRHPSYGGQADFVRGVISYSR